MELYHIFDHLSIVKVEKTLKMHYNYVSGVTGNASKI